jgi:hypothetical protein
VISFSAVDNSASITLCFVKIEPIFFRIDISVSMFAGVASTFMADVIGAVITSRGVDSAAAIIVGFASDAGVGVGATFAAFWTLVIDFFSAFVAALGFPCPWVAFTKSAAL